MTTINTTPVNQSNPRMSVEIRTDTLRNCLRDLRTHGREIAQAMGASGSRDITLDDNTELHLTQQSASERGMWHPETCVANRVGRDGEIVASYNVWPR